MMLEHFLLFVVIITLSIVQSVFGVGLLVFGTPILLLMGYSFELTLSYLLPASMAVSFVQVIHGWGEAKEFRVKIPMYVLPFTGLGLIFVLTYDRVLDVKLYVGIVMLLVGITRLTPHIKSVVEKVFSKHVNLFLIGTGLIHGATNMGGGPLTITVNSVVTKKESIRASIAYGYFLMAGIQVAVMILMGKFVFSNCTVIFPALSIGIYLFLGNKMFKVSTQLAYYHLMTILILLFGSSLFFVK